MTSNNPEEAQSLAQASAEGAAVPATHLRKPRYTLRPVVKPLPSQLAHEKPAPAGPGLRAENEDDDGYDPYSDFHDGTAGAPSFEADPWR